MTLGVAVRTSGARLRAVIVDALRRPSATQLKLLGAVAILVALASWALASPVGSTPDEDYHLGSIWCSHGIRDGLCEPGDTANSRKLPEQVIRDTCYMHDPNMSAACQTSPPTTGQMIDSTRQNIHEGSYPPVYYYVAGIFVGHDVSSSVITMRAVNALLFVALVASIYALVGAGLRRALVGSALVTAVPMGMFLIPSINPSGWAMLSAATLLVALLGHLTAQDRRKKIALGALAAVSLLIGAGARADAAMYSVVAVGVAVILTFRPEKGAWRRYLYPGALALAAFVAFLSVGQSNVIDASVAQGHAFSMGHVFRTVMEIPLLWFGGFGSWGLGWLDTNVPPVVFVGGWGIYAAVLFLAMARANTRRGLATGAVALAALVIPTYVQYLAFAPVGTGLQPRYILPLLTMLAVTAMTRLDGAPFRITTGQRWTIVVVLVVANSVAMHANMQRYLTGVDGIQWNLNRDIEWWWSIPISPLVVWAIGSLAFAVGVVLLTKELATASAATTGDPEAGSSIDRAGGDAAPPLRPTRDFVAVQAAGATQRLAQG